MSEQSEEALFRILAKPPFEKLVVMMNVEFPDEKWHIPIMSAKVTKFLKENGWGYNEFWEMFWYDRRRKFA